MPIRLPIRLPMREFALKPAPWAAWLGYAGLAPFIALALSVRFSPPEFRELSVFALTAYTATITSFLGAIHWGLAMREDHNSSTSGFNDALFAWGVFPSLVAWGALLASVFFDPAVALCVLGVLLWICHMVDRSIYPKFQLQNWLPMRLRLTLAASVSCFYAVAYLW